MQNKEIDIAVQGMRENPKYFRINSAAPLQNVLPRINQVLFPDQPPALDSCKVLVARQLSSAELSLDDSVEGGGLQLQNGDYLIIVPISLATGVSLSVYAGSHDLLIGKFSQESVFVGRRDPDEKIFPDIDLTPLLPINRENKVSRRSAYFVRKKDQWYIMKHPQARTQMFLDMSVIEAGKEYSISDGDSIGFGGSATSPETRLVCKLSDI